MDRGWRVQLCGRVVVLAGGRRLDGELPSRQGRLLFVYLAANRLRPVARDELAEALWPDRLPAAPESALNALLSKLRKLLGSDVLPQGGDTGLVLPAGSFVDLEAAAEAIHRAESALRLERFTEVWAPARVALHTARRGFLHGEQAPWIDAERRGLEQIELRAHECIAASSLALGGVELDSARRSSTALIERLPFRESGYRYLMETLHREGNGAEALAVYEQLRSVLRGELGVAPSETTRAVHRRLLQQQVD